MARKTTVGAYWLLAVCVALTGCQTTPPRNSYPQTYSRQGTTNPAQFTANPQTNGLSAAATSTATPGVGTLNNGVSGSGTIPTTTQPGSGTQLRSTAQPFTPSGSFTPTTGNPGAVGSSFTPTTGTGTANFPPPAFSPTTSGPAFNSPSIPPPANPSAPPLP